jgi:hypothetical protein
MSRSRRDSARAAPLAGAATIVTAGAEGFWCVQCTVREGAGAGRWGTGAGGGGAGDGRGLDLIWAGTFGIKNPSPDASLTFLFCGFSFF